MSTHHLYGQGLVKEEIFKLVTLYGFDRQIHDILEHFEEQDRIIKQDETRLSTAKQQLENKKKELLHKQMESERVDNDIKALEQRYKEFNYQLMNLKDEKSYDAMKTQLQDLRETISTRENDGITILNESEELQKTADMYQEKITAEEERINGIKSENTQELDKRKPELEELKAKRDDYAQAIRADVRSSYDRLLKLPDKKPMSEIDGRVCTSCYSDVTLDAVERVKMQEELVCCASCGRILFIPALFSKAEE